MTDHRLGSLVRLESFGCSRFLDIKAWHSLTPWQAIQVLSKKAFANLQNDYPVIEPDLSMVTNYEEMMKLVENRGDIQILDARPAGRFKGVDPEPRPGMQN